MSEHDQTPSLSEDERLTEEDLALLSGDAEEELEDTTEETEEVEAQESAPKEAVEAKEAVEEAAAEPEAETFRPRYEAQLPDGYTEQVKALREQVDGLAQKYRDGDIDFDEYHGAQARLAEQREELLLARAKAEIAADMTAQTDAQLWQSTIQGFLSDVARSEKVDYHKDDDRMRDLDLFVKALGGDERNADRPMRWFLEEAHRRVNALHGVAETTAPRAKVPTVKPPTTLAGVPGTHGPGDVGDDTFSEFDRLSGFEAEDAFSRMSKSQQDRYLGMN